MVAIEFNGECMGDLISHGAVLGVDTKAPIQPLDMVAVILEDFSGPWARFVNGMSGEGFAGLVKIFFGIYEVDGETVYLCGQLNPPTLVPIPSSAISAIYRIDITKECHDDDRKALKLLKPFAGIGLHKAAEAA